MKAPPGPPAAAVKKKGKPPKKPVKKRKPAKQLTPKQEAAADRVAARQESARARTERSRSASYAGQSRAAAAQEKVDAITATRLSEQGDPRGAAISKARAVRDRARAKRDKVAAVRDRARAGKERQAAAHDRVKAHYALLGAPAPFPVAGPAVWVMGGNDWHSGCAAAAVANSLLATTGHRVTDQDVTELYFATTRGADTGASMAATLGALAERGIGGWFPAGIRWLPGLPEDPDGVIVGLPGHAAVLYDGGLITWGRRVAAEAWDHCLPEGTTARPPGGWQVDWAAPLPGGTAPGAAGRRGCPGTTAPGDS